ncbi:MAG: cytochrome c [Gammaproteobacteria bacterium]|nr:cytochrome c [Gammaproteobacteria bacterium]
MNKPVKQVVGLIVVTAALLIGSVASAQPKTVKDGVFTAEQALAGEMVYESNCKTCHDMKFYKNTLRSWNSQPLVYLWETIMGTMPADNPGSMMLKEYTNVLAYILSENGFPSGDVALDPDHGMDAISIVSP